MVRVPSLLSPPFCFWLDYIHALFLTVIFNFVYTCTRTH